MEKIRMTLNLLALDVIGRLGARMGPVDDRGGGRNTDEGFHISGGAIVAGAIAAGVGAFIARKLGALGD
ncbi:hypothetical protein ACVGOW_12075 [Pseudonocardia saturnea]